MTSPGSTSSQPIINSPSRTCVRCVMDTTDPAITFDEHGVCSHCARFETLFRPNWFPTPEGRHRLEAVIKQIKSDGEGKDYDCIIGLSGGVDSSWLAVKVKELGLRPLVVHVDAGWNSQLAVQNIQNLVEKLEFDLHTIVIDWEEMQDLQVSFLRSGVANQDVPQDHAFFAGLYAFAKKAKIRWVLSGGNYATEGILPQSWGYNAMDVRHLKGIHRRFGTRPLRTFPTVSFFDLYIGYPILCGMKVFRPLDFIPYTKAAAMAELSAHYGWQYYGGKHYESVWTKFFQGHWLPTRFGFDKRKAHLSSLVVAGELSRTAALAELEKPAYPADDLRRDLIYVAKKLGLAPAELEQLHQSPRKTYLDYPHNEDRLKLLRRLWRALPLKGLLRKPSRF